MSTKIIMVLSLSVFAFLSWGKFKNKLITQKIAQNLVPQSSCLQKKKCGIIYVAPWCPACNSLIPQLQPFLANAKNNSEYGIQMVVGKGKTQDSNYQKAEEIGHGTKVDADGSIAEALRVTYYPTILVVNEKQVVEMRDQEALSWIQASFQPN